LAVVRLTVCIAFSGSWLFSGTRTSSFCMIPQRNCSVVLEFVEAAVNFANK